MTELRRRLGRSDAVIVGVGSMIGAGVFSVWGPAAEAAGGYLLIGLVIAGIVAVANATSSAQLAAQHPESGGTYVYARLRLSPFWGHVAGWGFVVGKTASCAAMALTIGAYVWPDQARSVATVAVCAILAINLGGLERTVAVTRVLLVVAGTTLLIVVLGSLLGGDDSMMIVASDIDASPFGVLRSAGLTFFAFAGYARIATLGEEVREPETTIPWAVPRALGAVLVIYLIVAATALATVPAGALATSDAPLALVVDLGQFSGLGWIIDIGAAVACLGVLLNLIPGVSRTTLAMARRRELPSILARVDTKRQHPVIAELVVTLAVLVCVQFFTLTSAIAVSGLAVLTYYGITNAAALRLTPSERRWPTWLARVGLVGCAALAVSLPTRAMLGGVIVLALGIVARQFIPSDRRD